MSNNNIRDLVIRDDDKIIEYRAPSKEKETKKDLKNLTNLELYNKFLESDEFKLPESKEKVLQEDDYINYLEEIICRDYFPDLYRSKQFEKEVNKFHKIAKFKIRERNP